VPAEAPLRSVMFIPAGRPTWLADIDGYGADAVILDLEDSVPEDGKSAARDLVAQTLHGAAFVTTVFVRVNGPGTGRMVDDLRAVVGTGCAGVCVPKVATSADLHGVDAVLRDAEVRAGAAVGGVGVLLIPETAPALRDLAALACGPRVRWLAGVSARDGDVARSVGFEWSEQGIESLMLQSKAVLDARAAGIEHPIGGLWQDVRDVEGFERRARHHRALGFAGELLLHPGQIEVAHRVYTPSQERLDHYRGLVEAVQRGRSEGRGAVVYAGQHVDEAHLQTAMAFLEVWDGARA
jgi:citrate lyase subunit beta/citryl-CoA lyase